MNIVDTIHIDKERKKILDGTYPFKVIDGRQRKHIEGTKEFEDKRLSMQRYNINAEPSIVLPSIDIQKLVDRYKGSGRVYFVKGSLFPREQIMADIVVGKTWVTTLKKYVPTRMFVISYSKTGVHIFPINDTRSEEL